MINKDTNLEPNSIKTEKMPEDPVAYLKKINNLKTRLALSLGAFSVIIFLLLTNFLPFRDRLFSLLYPKPSSKAAVCNGPSLISAKKSGFVYTGGDLNQISSTLNTSLYYSYDASLAKDKNIHVIGKYVGNLSDPLSLTFLMDNNLSNTDFRGLWGQKPAGWEVSTPEGSGVWVETVPSFTVNGGTSVRVKNLSSSTTTSLYQTYKKEVREGSWIIYGAWVKTSQPDLVKLYLTDAKSADNESTRGLTAGVSSSSQKNNKFGEMQNNPEKDNWSYILGMGQVPVGVTSFQLKLDVGGENNTTWFDGAVASDTSSEENQMVSDLVLGRCGSAWMVDRTPGFDQSYQPLMPPLSPKIYALVYHQFYNLIKASDPVATVLPGGIYQGDGVFDKGNTYSPKKFLDEWRSSYKEMFGSEPPLDAMNIHYLSLKDDPNLDAFNSYLSSVRNYMDQLPEWKSQPIWISELGFGSSLGNQSSIVSSMLEVLSNNKLNIAKWFWFDTCGFNPYLLALYKSQDKICSWPMELSTVGKIYQESNIEPTLVPSIITPTEAGVAAPTLEPTKVESVSPTPIESGPTTAQPEPTSTIVLPTETPVPTKEASPGGTVTSE